MLDSEAVDGVLKKLQKHSSHKELIRACESCLLSKMHRAPFGEERDYKVEKPNDMAVADVMGPFLREEIQEGKQTVVVKSYLSLIVDVYSRNVNARIITRKSEASDHVKAYYHSSRNITQHALRHFHTDGGTEYNAAETTLTERGVKVTRTAVNTPQHNGIAERKNRTILDMARSLLAHAKLDPRKFAREAILAAVYIHNRVNIVAKLKKTQFELFTGHRPNLSNMRVFGCDAYVHIADENKRKGKLTPRAEKGIFVGYDLQREGCWKIAVGNKLVASRDVDFKELQFTAMGRQPTRGANNSSSSLAPLPVAMRDHSNSDSSPSSSDSEQEDSDLDRRTQRKLQQLQREESRKQEEEKIEEEASSSNRRSKRKRKNAAQTGLNPDDFGQFALQTETGSPMLVDDEGGESIEKESAAIAEELRRKRLRETDVKIPATVRAARTSPYARYFQHAMAVEMESMRSLGVYTLTTAPAGVNVVGAKWVFNVKAKDGIVTRFKARLVARGFSQQHGVDYEETYSPVMKYKTLRLLLAIVAAHDLELELMDVITAYLNAPLKEVVYMQQPE
jgi:transposase InsO family protein